MRNFFGIIVVFFILSGCVFRTPDANDYTIKNQMDSETTILVDEDKKEESMQQLVEENAKIISSTQNFEDLKKKESIIENEEKLSELKKYYKTFTIESLPKRSERINLKEFAYKNRNKKIGKSRFSRRVKDYSINYCKEYVDQNLAQIMFLSQGGPRRDTSLLDKDGDGFACDWTPKNLGY